MQPCNLSSQASGREWFRSGLGHEGGRHVYRTSPSGRFIEKDQVPMTSAKGEHVVIYRDRHTGRFTTRKSAKHIEKVSKASAESLKRLAKR